MVRQPRLWDHIGERGGRVCVIGVPVTYPPRRVNGLLITGILTPQGASYTYPEELAPELEAQVGGFPFQPEHWRGRFRAREWLAKLNRTIEQRKRVARFLLNKNHWDFFMVHFMELDSVQHQMWHLRDGVVRPRYRVKVEGDPILEIYRAADAAVGELSAELPPETTVFVISDHGFGPLYWNIYLNTWLLEQGYLALKRGVLTELKRAAFRLGLSQERLFTWAERLRLLEGGAQLRHGQLHDLLGRFFLSLADVDWQRTRAYSYGNIGQIYLNKRGREPEGIVGEAEAEGLIEELIAKLRQLVNPYNGEPVIERFYRKEELYSGERLAWAPELLFLPRRGCMTLGTTDFPAARVVAPTFAGSGWHELFGVLIAAGKGLARGKVEGACLLDIFPTILYAMGLPVPRGLDGRVLEELFKPDYRRAHPLKWSQEVELGPEVEEEPEGWEEEARRRLKDLGYV